MCGGVAGAVRFRADQGVVGAVGRRRTGGVQTQVVADGERRQSSLGGRFPGRTEGRGPGVAAVERPGCVGAFEPTPTQTAEKDVFAVAQHDQVDVAVAIDVDRVGAVHVVEICYRIGQPGELQRAADRTVVAEERGWTAPAGDVEVGFAVVVAVEGGDAAAHGERRVAVVDVVNPGRRRSRPRSGVAPNAVVGAGLFGRRPTKASAAIATAATPTTSPSRQRRMGSRYPQG